MRCGINPSRQTGHDGNARFAQRLAKSAGIGQTLQGRIAAADDCHDAPAEATLYRAKHADDRSGD